MRLKILGFWCVVAIEGAIACVFSQRAISAVLANPHRLVAEALGVKETPSLPLSTRNLAGSSNQALIQSAKISPPNLVAETFPLKTASLTSQEIPGEILTAEVTNATPDYADFFNRKSQLLESESVEFKVSSREINLVSNGEIQPNHEVIQKLIVIGSKSSVSPLESGSSYLTNRHGKLIAPEPFGLSINHDPLIQASNIEIPLDKEPKSIGKKLAVNSPQDLQPVVAGQVLPTGYQIMSNPGMTLQASEIAIPSRKATPEKPEGLAGETDLSTSVSLREKPGQQSTAIAQVSEINIPPAAASFLLDPATLSPQTIAQTQTPPAPPQITPQPDPNRDRFLQPAPAPLPIPPETQPSVSPTPTPTPSPEAGNQSIQVNKVEVTGSTVFSQEQLNSITKELEGKTVNIDALRDAADKITQLYLNRGDITSRAILGDQAITNGVVQIRVIEGSLERIDVEGTHRLNPEYIRSRVRLGGGSPLNTGKLEDQLRLLRADPLFSNVEASLRAGTGIGQSILVVRVTEANPLQAYINIDNYSPPSVGSERLGGNVLYRNLTGRGDEISAAYNHTTTGGADIFDLSYRIPLNPMNGTLQLRTSLNRNHVTQPPFDQFDIKGDSQLYELSYRQPLVRTPREEFALSLGFAYQNGQTFTFAGPTPFGFGPDENGVSRTSVLKFGQDYVRRDVSGAWSLRSLFSLGTGLLDATINPDPKPDGRFLAWLGQIQRVQVLNNDNFLILQGDIQLTPNSLLPSQQFVIGGGQSLRGYRQNVRAGDNGIRLSLEDRITIQRDPAGTATMILAPFIDAGWIWNKADNPNVLQEEQFLAGTGLGLIWTPLPRLNLRVDYGIPLVNIKDRGTNAQDQGFYFSVNYQL